MANLPVKCYVDTRSFHEGISLQEHECANIYMLLQACGMLVQACGVLTQILCKYADKKKFIKMHGNNTL